MNDSIHLIQLRRPFGFEAIAWTLGSLLAVLAWLPQPFTRYALPASPSEQVSDQRLDTRAPVLQLQFPLPTQDTSSSTRDFSPLSIERSSK